MTLDEAIIHCEEVVEKKQKEFSYYQDHYMIEYFDSCEKCIDDYKQLAEWLKELKELKQNNTTNPVITKSDIEKANEIFNDKDFWNINDKAKKLLKKTNTTDSVLEDIKAEIDNESIGYPPSADYYKAIKKAVRIIDKHISRKKGD